MHIVMKSAGDAYSFCSVLINGKTGHSKEYATELALNMTRAMKFYLENKDGVECSEAKIVESQEGEFIDFAVHRADLAEKYNLVLNGSPALLPCPFCGGQAIMGMFSIWCERCRVATEQDVTPSKDELIKLWNTRPKTNQFDLKEREYDKHTN